MKRRPRVTRPEELSQAVQSQPILSSFILFVSDRAVKLPPSVSLNSFIDDSHQSAQGPPDKVLREIVKAGNTFVLETRNHLQVVVATAKTAVISSHRRVAVGVAEELGMAASAVRQQTVELGVDVSAGSAVLSLATKKSARMKKKKLSSENRGSGHLPESPTPKHKSPTNVAYTQRVPMETHFSESLMSSVARCSNWRQRLTPLAKQTDPVCTVVVAGRSHGSIAPPIVR